MSPQMLLSMNMSLILPLYIFKQIIQQQKIRIVKILRIFFLLDLSSYYNPVIESTYVSKPKSMCKSDPKPMPISESEPEHQQYTNSAFLNVRIGKFFSRKKVFIPKSMQFQDSNPNLNNEVTIYEPWHYETDSQLNKNDLDLPIAFRKGTRECTKWLVIFYLFLFFQKIFSISEKFSCYSLNTVFMPKSLSEALTKEEWRQAMNVEMEAFGKDKTWQIVRLPAGKIPMAINGSTQ